MDDGHPILAEGQHEDGTWEEDPPPGYEPIRFSVNGCSLGIDEQVELLVQGAWVQMTFHGYANHSLAVKLSFELGYRCDPVEYVTVPIDARFRLLSQRLNV